MCKNGHFLWKKRINFYLFYAIINLRVITMKILICDDTQSELSVTYKYVNEYFKEKNIHAKINTFTDPNLAINHLVFEDGNLVEEASRIDFQIVDSKDDWDDENTENDASVLSQMAFHNNLIECNGLTITNQCMEMCDVTINAS